MERRCQFSSNIEMASQFIDCTFIFIFELNSCLHFTYTVISMEGFFGALTKMFSPDREYKDDFRDSDIEFEEEEKKRRVEQGVKE